MLTSNLILCGAILAACGYIEPTAPVTQGNEFQEYTPSMETDISSELKSQFPDNGYSIELDTVQEEISVRAQINTDHGVLSVVSTGTEEVGHITTPSVFGAEGDVTFRGNYNVVLSSDSSEQVIKEFKDLIFVQKSHEPITFDVIPFEKVDIYLLTPEYMATRGTNSYVIGINKENGEAFPITFNYGKNVRETINYAVDHFPQNESEKLVVMTRNNEGENQESEIKPFTFTLDLDNKQFILETDT